MDDIGREERAEYDSITFRTLSGLGSSVVAGTLIGAVAATWQDVPAVARNKAWPGLVKTGLMVRSYGILFGAVGGTFAFVDAVSESIRDKKDFVNGVIGGFAAGGVLGLRMGKVPVGLGAGAAMAFASALLDANGQTTRVVTGREYLPYPSKHSKH